MMSTNFPVFSYEQGPTNPVPAFETGFTPWDSSDLFSMLHSSIEPVEMEPGLGKPDSGQIQNQTISNPGSESKIQNQTGSDLVAADLDDRKKKRKLSNRESARRSRMRKQTHLDNLRNQLDRLRVENRELEKRLRLVLYHCHCVRTENDSLRLEHGLLQQKLLNMRQILMLRQIEQSSTYAMWPCNNSAVNVITIEQNPPLIPNHVI